MIARILLSLAIGVGTDVAVMWAFGPPDSIVTLLCLIGIGACIVCAAMVLPLEES